MSLRETKVRPPNHLGKASVVIGLIAVLSRFLSVINVTAWPLAVIGLVLAGFSFSSKRETNTALPVLGLVLSATAGILYLIPGW